MAIGLSIIVALIGCIVGLSMATSRRATPCENGHQFSAGTTEFTCYSHPQGGLGTAIVLFSLLLGTLVVISGITAMAVLRSPSQAEGSEPSP